MSVKAQKQATLPKRGESPNHRRKSRKSAREQFQLAVFPTDLGWGALLATKDKVEQVVLGRASAAAALADVDTSLVEDATPKHSWQKLIKRLQDFARGRIVDFSDVPLSFAGFTPFQQAILRECRKVPYGQTISYGELAVRAGSPRAARAVGSTMAACRQAIIVPCHRVISASGAAGGFGGPAGVRFKRQLLELEQQALARTAKPRSKARSGR
jgi:methylated-DNA-[protein]-cysteine S-methyltransferase